MGQLVLLVVAAAWAAVLLPPLLRSRVENRPNSSVTDFRRQLNRLQSTVPSRASGHLRPVGRPLAPSPSARTSAPARYGDEPPMRRSHSQPGHAAHRVISGSEVAAHRHDPVYRPDRRPSRQHAPAAARRAPSVNDVRRRRTNVLFLLAMTAAGSLFLAATTKATLMLYLFALSFLALCGYVYLLAQIRQREQEQAWAESWQHARLRR